MPVHYSASEADTERIGAELAGSLHAGVVLLLSGDLGAGKTAFVRGLARGLGIDPAEVSSPTFALVHEYTGSRFILYHADLYRLNHAVVEDLGLEEMGVRDGILAIEWPERLSHGLAGARRVSIAITGDARREVRIEEAGEG